MITSNPLPTILVLLSLPALGAAQASPVAQTLPDTVEPALINCGTAFGLRPPVRQADPLPYPQLQALAHCRYASILLSLGEPPLAASTPANTVSYRLLVVPTFRPSTSVRVNVSPEHVVAVTSRTQGLGGYASDGLDTTVTDTFPPALRDSPLSELAAEITTDAFEEPGGDGTCWVLEIRRGERAVLQIRCPLALDSAPTSFAALSAFLAALAPWRVE